MKGRAYDAFWVGIGKSFPYASISKNKKNFNKLEVPVSNIIIEAFFIYILPPQLNIHPLSLCPLYYLLSQQQVQAIQKGHLFDHY